MLTFTLLRWCTTTGRALRRMKRVKRLYCFVKKLTTVISFRLLKTQCCDAFVLAGSYVSHQHNWGDIFATVEYLILNNLIC